MRKKYLLLVFIFLLITQGFSQAQDKKEWLVKIIEHEKGIPVSFATVSINRKQYFPADENGTLTLNTNLLKTGDTVLVSAIGYNSRFIVIDLRLPLPAVIELTADIVQLNEVKVRYRKPEEITIGKTGLFLSFGFLSSSYIIYAHYIPNNKKVSGTVEAVEFNLSNAGNDIKGPFKATIYSKSDRSKYPDKEMINDDMIIQNPGGKKKLVIDLTKYNIKFPENGLFIVVKMLSPEYYSSRTFYKFGNYREELPSFSCYEKKNVDNGYSLFMGPNQEWHIFEPFNFLFRLKILKD